MGDGGVRSRGDPDGDGLDRLRATATRHASWRTRAVVLTRLLVTRAGLCHDQGVDAGGTERQQRYDDCEGEAPHQLILALAQRACRRGPFSMSDYRKGAVSGRETGALPVSVWSTVDLVNEKQDCRGGADESVVRHVPFNTPNRGPTALSAAQPISHGCD